MSETFLKQVKLDPKMLRDKDSMADYMKQELDLPAWFGGNLDALADCLSEVTQETVFEVESGSLILFLAEGYPKKALRVIYRAAQENPHLHLYLTGFEWLFH